MARRRPGRWFASRGSKIELNSILDPFAPVCEAFHFPSLTHTCALRKFAAALSAGERAQAAYRCGDAVVLAVNNPSGAFSRSWAARWISRRIALTRAHFGLPPTFQAATLEDEAAGGAASVAATTGRAAAAVRWADRRKLGRFGPPSAAHPRPACSVSKSSCTCAQRTGCAQGAAPSALPGSTAAIGCLSHRPDACTCRPRRDQPAQAGRGEPPELVNTRHWPAVMTPRLIGLPADHAVASHRAADGADPSIEGARTHAGATSRGAAGRFPRVSAL